MLAGSLEIVSKPTYCIRSGFDYNYGAQQPEQLWNRRQLPLHEPPAQAADRLLKNKLEKVSKALQLSSPWLLVVQAQQHITFVCHLITCHGFTIACCSLLTVKLHLMCTRTRQLAVLPEGVAAVLTGGYKVHFGDFLQHLVLQCCSCCRCHVGCAAPQDKFEFHNVHKKCDAAGGKWFYPWTPRGLHAIKYYSHAVQAAVAADRLHCLIFKENVKNLNFGQDVVAQVK